MTIVVNGETLYMADGATVVEVVAHTRGMSGVHKGVAVAVNGEVVPRSDWESATLSDGDKVEVLHAIGGGA